MQNHLRVVRGPRAHQKINLFLLLSWLQFHRWICQEKLPRFPSFRFCNQRRLDFSTAVSYPCSSHTAFSPAGVEPSMDSSSPPPLPLSKGTSGSYGSTPAPQQEQLLLFPMSLLSLFLNQIFLHIARLSLDLHPCYTLLIFAFLSLRPQTFPFPNSSLHKGLPLHFSFTSSSPEASSANTGISGFRHLCT